MWKYATDWECKFIKHIDWCYLVYGMGRTINSNGKKMELEGCSVVIWYSEKVGTRYMSKIIDGYIMVTTTEHTESRKVTSRNMVVPMMVGYDETTQCRTLQNVSRNRISSFKGSSLNRYEMMAIGQIYSVAMINIVHVNKYFVTMEGRTFKIIRVNNTWMNRDEVLWPPYVEELIRQNQLHNYVRYCHPSKQMVRLIIDQMDIVEKSEHFILTGAVDVNDYEYDYIDDIREQAEGVLMTLGLQREMLSNYEWNKEHWLSGFSDLKVEQP